MYSMSMTKYFFIIIIYRDIKDKVVFQKIASITIRAKN